MTLEEYINNLQECIKENPEAANYEVVYAIDSEGNGYEPVYYLPTLMFRDEYDEYHSDEDIDDSDEPNVVCIN